MKVSIKFHANSHTTRFCPQVQSSLIEEVNFFVCLFIFIVFISLFSLLASLPFVSTMGPQPERREVLAIPVVPVIINSDTIARSARHVQTLSRPIFRPGFFFCLLRSRWGVERPPSLTSKLLMVRTQQWHKIMYTSFPTFRHNLIDTIT